MCHGTTKAGLPCKNGANCRWHSEGAGFADWIEKPLAAVAEPIIRGLSGLYRSTVRGPRTGPTRRLEEFMRSESGRAPITGLFVARTPLSTGARTLLDALSLGRFSKAAKKLGYDDVFHNALFAATADGKVHRIEKNHVVGVSEAQASDEKFSFHNVPLPADRNLTIQDLLTTAAKREAEAGRGKEFWQYDGGGGDNCQRFVLDVVRSSGLEGGITDLETLEVIQPQDAGALVNSLGAASGVPLQITNIAGRLDRLRFGDGTVGPQISASHLSVKELFDHVNLSPAD